MDPISRKDKWTLFSLSLGHFINDSYSNFFGPLLPLLLLKLKITMTQAGWLVAMQVISSSFMQPVYGYLSDRWFKRIFVVFSPLVTAGFMSFLGVAPNYWTLAFLLICGGVGIASFHPQAASMASLAIHRQKGLGMSIFVTSGSLGYALGPLIITSIVSLVGLERSYLVLLPGLITFVLLHFFVPRAEDEVPSNGGENLWRLIQGIWKPLSLLYLLVVLRSAVQMAFVSFLPLYLSLRGYDSLTTGRITTAFLFFGAVGGFTGGSLADKFGERNIILWSMLLSSPFFLGFLWTQGFLSFVLLSLGGTILFSTVPVNVVMAQKLIPLSSSTVSALMMGFAWGVGGLIVPVFGKLADLAGLNHAFLVAAILPLAGFFLSLRLRDRAGSLCKESV
jgi:FSR family fosmidomycin resistance protein-like MFS transporter